MAIHDLKNKEKEAQWLFYEELPLQLFHKIKHGLMTYGFTMIGP